MTETRTLPRREAVAVGATGISLIALVACSSAPASSSGGTSSAAASVKAGEPVVKLADLKVGDSASGELDGKPILLNRTDDATVVAFSAICTHNGCKVNPAGKELHCPCHGSKYDATTGAVLGGPAPKPLPKVDVHVTDGQVLSGAAS